MKLIQISKIKWDIGIITLISFVYIAAGSTITVTEVEGTAKKVIPEEFVKDAQKKKAKIEQLRLEAHKNAEKEKRHLEKKDQRLYEALNNDKKFYKSVLDISFEQARYLGATDSKSTWGKFLNLSEDNLRVTMRGLDDYQMSQILLANAAIFSLAEWQMEQKGTLGSSVLELKNQEDNNYYTTIFHDSYKRALGAHFKGTHEDWEERLRAQDKLLLDIINQRSSIQVDRMKVAIAFSAWNDVISHQKAGQLLRSSFERAKKAGFNKGIYAWTKVLNSKNTNIGNTAAVWSVASEFIAPEAWNSLYFPSQNNLALNYKGTTPNVFVVIRESNNRRFAKCSHQTVCFSF